MPLAVELIPCLTDNYAYLLHDPADGLCAVVDPSEPEPVKRRWQGAGWTLTHILNTHHHFDHTGGNIALKQEFGAEVVGPGKDRARIPGMDVGVGEDGAVAVRRSHRARAGNPGAHARAYRLRVRAGTAFTGDTLFAMGCGRLFEGTPQMMWTASPS